MLQGEKLAAILSGRQYIDMTDMSTLYGNSLEGPDREWWHFFGETLTSFHTITMTMCHFLTSSYDITWMLRKESIERFHHVITIPQTRKPPSW